MTTTKRQKKMDIASNLYEKLQKAKSVVVTDYRGLTTAQLLELRQKLADVSGEYTVTKNTLLQRALTQNGQELHNEVLEGPSATLLAYDDEVSPVKTLTTFAKTVQLPKIKGGYFDGQFLSAEQVDRLAKLPGKDALRGQVVGTIQAPIYNFVSVLQGNIRNLVYVLNGIKEAKG